MVLPLLPAGPPCFLFNIVIIQNFLVTPFLKNPDVIKSRSGRFTIPYFPTVPLLKLLPGVNLSAIA